MNAKLTIQLDNTVINEAKEYASEQKTSLSKMIESYLRAVISSEKKNIKISPLVKDLTGIIDLPNDFDVKQEYGDYLSNKYK